MKKFNSLILKKLIEYHAFNKNKKRHQIRQEIIDGLGLKNKQSLSDYERGKYAPPMKRQVWLAEYFEVSVEYFYQEVNHG